MRVRVFINSAAGSVDDENELIDTIEKAFDKAGADAAVDVVDPSDVADMVTRWWDGDDRPDVIVAAGGDGSVNCLARAAAGTDIVTSVLPLGTFNHFAADIGLPDDMDAAAAGIVGGTERAVDVAEVNGEIFVNNSALGVYPAMVSARDRISDRHGWGKVRAVPVACVQVLRQLPAYRIDITGSGGFERRRVRTSFVFVGNGRYDNADGGLPERVDLVGGNLHLAMTSATSRWGLVRTAVSALLSGLRRTRDLDEIELTELDVGGRGKRLLVARDGEIDRMELPLRYRCRPGALIVRAPLPES